LTRWRRKPVRWARAGSGSMRRSYSRSFKLSRIWECWNLMWAIPAQTAPRHPSHKNHPARSSRGRQRRSLTRTAEVPQVPCLRRRRRKRRRRKPKKRRKRRPQSPRPFLRYRDLGPYHAPFATRLSHWSSIYHVENAGLLSTGSAMAFQIWRRIRPNGPATCA
jgi:hypothetical protein